MTLIMRNRQDEKDWQNEPKKNKRRKGIQLKRTTTNDPKPVVVVVVADNNNEEVLVRIQRLELLVGKKERDSSTTNNQHSSSPAVVTTSSRSRTRTRNREERKDEDDDDTYWPESEPEQRPGAIRVGLRQDDDDVVTTADDNDVVEDAPIVTTTSDPTVAAVAIDESGVTPNEEVDELRRENEQWRQADQLRTQEMEERRAKRRKCYCICGCVTIIVLAIIGGVTYYFLPTEDNNIKTGNDNPTGSSPLVEMPPSDEVCNAIADADNSYFDGIISSDKKEIGLVVEAIFQNDNNIDGLLPNIEESLQEDVLPYLAGCTQENTRRRLAFLRKQRQLTNLGNIILFGKVSDTIQESGACTTSSDASCKRVTAKLDLSLKREANCDEILNHLNGMLKDVPEKLPNFLFDIGFESTVLLSANTCSVSSPNVANTVSPSDPKIEPTGSPTTKEPTVNPSEKPTKAPVVGTFSPTKATPNPTNVPTKSPTPGPTCVAIEGLFEDVLDAEPQDNKDELSYSLECPKDFLDLIVLAKASAEEDGNCEVTCLGHVTADSTEGVCTDKVEEEYSVILETGDLDLEDLTLVLGYVNEDLPQNLECPEDSLVLSTKAPTAMPTTPVPTPQPTTPAPTLAPTIDRSFLEELLLKYFDNPLSAAALTWLTNEDKWLPSEDSKTTMVTGPNGVDQSLWDALWVDRYALVVFYYATNGNLWNFDGLWLSDQSVCMWYNTYDEKCNANGQIIALALNGNKVSGQIPTELGSLTALKGLSLQSNQLVGKIPRELRALTSLEILYLPNNQLTGWIPAELGYLTPLKQLALHNNQLAGSIPYSLRSLINLVYCNLTNNNFSSTLYKPQRCYV